MKKGKTECFAALRKKVEAAGKEFNRLCPESDDRKEAMKYLEKAYQYASASIARHT